MISKSLKKHFKQRKFLQFNDELKQTSDNDYEHAVIACNGFEMETMKNCHDLC